MHENLPWLPYPSEYIIATPWMIYSQVHPGNKVYSSIVQTSYIH